MRPVLLLISGVILLKFYIPGYPVSPGDEGENVESSYDDSDVDPNMLNSLNVSSKEINSTAG